MSKYKVSPFAPETFPNLPPIAGFTMATAEAGVKYQGRTDLWVMRADAGTQVAGVFTQNLCPGAPVDWSRRALSMATEGPRLVVVNSGTANVFGGQKSRDAVSETVEGIAAYFDCEASAVLLASTGVIGEPLEASKLVAKFPEIKADLKSDGWEAGARAIMTTDTHAKGASVTSIIDGVKVGINGIAKGSGMIAPDMATMLAFVATDANISQEVLQSLLSELTQSTFNAITVDSDTSTSDTLLLFASGAAKHHKIVDIDDPDAVSDISAKRIGMSIANSPLVKTAIAGEDANWGRIVMAVGKAGEPAERDKLSIWMGPHLLAQQGQRIESYSELDGSDYMKNDEIEIKVNLGLGTGRAIVYTCDLTHAYIDINADYRS